MLIANISLSHPGFPIKKLLSVNHPDFTCTNPLNNCDAKRTPKLFTNFTCVSCFTQPKRLILLGSKGEGSKSQYKFVTICLTKIKF